MSTARARGSPQGDGAPVPGGSECGTELEIVQEGLPPVIPVENCYLGWQESLSLLAQLVEAEIPG